MSDPTASRYVIPASTQVGLVQLRIADLERSLAFYRDVLGYQAEINDSGKVATLAAGAPMPDFALHERSGIGPAPARVAGLYHAAILLPSRADLARIVRQLAGHGIPFGQADHGVSEALYINDPDGNGLEIYADRPREQWPTDEQGVAMVVEPIDFEDLLGELADDDEPWSAMPAGTRIGHVHLRVSDLAQSREFYVDKMGFQVMQESMPSALFVSAGGYHHHLGMNVWESRGQPLAGEDVAGLISFAVELPAESDRERLIERLEQAGVEFEPADVPVIHDPDGIIVESRVQG